MIYWWYCKLSLHPLPLLVGVSVLTDACAQGSLAIDHHAAEAAVRGNVLDGVPLLPPLLIAFAPMAMLDANGSGKL